MKFSREDLKEGVWDNKTPGPTVLKEFLEHKRWSLRYRRVFEFGGKFYETFYGVAATECQDESPYDYEKQEVECAEVVPVQKTVTAYERCSS